MNYSDIFNKIKFTNQPILLVLNKNSNPLSFLKQYISILIGKAYNEFDLSNFLDLIQFNGHIEKIKKENILKIQTFCSYSAIEQANKKFYFINHIDNCTKEAYNSLLKFLEEPYESIYGVLTTSNLSVIPSTIKSRCQIIQLFSDQEDIEQIINNNSSINSNHWIFKIFNDINELSNLLNNDKFYKLDNIVNVLSKQDWININFAKEQYMELNYYDIDLLLTILLTFTNNKQCYQLLEIKEKIFINPIKPLIFSKLLQIFSTKD